MEYSIYEIEALSYHFGMSCKEVRETEFTQDEIERAIANYDGPFSGPRRESYKWAYEE